MTGSDKAFVQEYFTKKSLFITRDWNNTTMKRNKI